MRWFLLAVRYLQERGQLEEFVLLETPDAAEEAAAEEVTALPAAGLRRARELQVVRGRMRWVE